MSSKYFDANNIKLMVSLHEFLLDFDLYSVNDKVRALQGLANDYIAHNSEWFKNNYEVKLNEKLDKLINKSVD